MNPLASLRRALVAFDLVLGATALLACSSPSVGDTCSGPCPSPATCEAVCECGNASCLAFACVVVSSTGAYQLEDGGQAPSCSTP